MALGFDVHALVAVCGINWTGRPSSANLGEPVPLAILHLMLEPASSDAATIGVEIIDRAKKVAPNLNEIAADRGFSEKGKRYNRELHKKSVSVVMDYKKNWTQTVRTLMLGRRQHKLIENCGTFFGEWLPESLHKPPPGLTGDERTAWFNERAKFRYSPVEHHAHGDIRMTCPQCAGRIQSNLQTRNRHVKVKKDAPFFHRTSNSGYCCSGRVTVPVEKLDFYQPIPFGTTAWWESYGRRNQIENVNGILKDKAGLTPGWCRTLNGISRFVGVVMVVIALHLREFKQYELGPDSSDDHETDQDASTSPSDGHKPTARSRDGPA